MRKHQPKYEIEYVAQIVTAKIVKGLCPYLVDEAHRRGVSIDTVISQIVNEDLARKRIQSRKKEGARLSDDLAPVVAK